MFLQSVKVPCACDTFRDPAGIKLGSAGSLAITKLITNIRRTSECQSYHICIRKFVIPKSARKFQLLTSF